jgi:response regulator RpfG family c-di-GMP phosphodiesterase
VDRQRILILDDEECIIQALGKMLRNQGYGVIACLHPQEALKRLEEGGIDMVISDLRMPQMTGIEFLIQVKDICPNAATILLIDSEDRELVVAAINQGTVDWYVEKPWDEEIIKITIASTVKYRRILLENKRLQQVIRKQGRYIETLVVTS